MAIYSGYVGAKTCTQGPTTGARGAMAWFLAKYADDGGLNAGIYNCRDIRGGTTTSLHGEGRAFDAAIRPYSAKYGTELADLIRRHSAELGVQCVIWNRQIWSGYYTEFRPYTGVNPHVDHLHVELTWEAANRSAAGTVALWEKVLGDLVDDDTVVKPAATKPPTTPAKPSAGGSVVDWLNGKGRDSSHAARARLAAQYGIGGYKGTATQNTTLLAKLKAGAPAPAAKPKPAPAKPKPAPASGYKGDSVVDYLASIGKASTYAARANLADRHGISGYKGTAAQNTALLAELRGGAAPKATAKPKKKVTGSLVDYLKSRGRNSSYSARAKLAAQYGIKNYTGTAAQNTALLAKIQD